MLAAALVAAATAAATPALVAEPVATGPERARVRRPACRAAPGVLAAVERYGRVRLDPARAARGATTLIDMRDQVGIADARETDDQRGLLSIAFAPDYRRTERVYVDYVDRQSRQRVAVWSARGAAPAASTSAPRPTSTTAGSCSSAPTACCYVSTGMGDDDSVSQDPAPPGRQDPARAPRRRAPEIVALGLRNPWRFSFHRGALLIGDVGGDAVEEIDMLPRGTPPGANFGWPFREGARRPRARRARRACAPPALTYRARRRRWCSIVGGYVLHGRYLYGDVCSGRRVERALRADAAVRRPLHRRRSSRTSCRSGGRPAGASTPSASSATCTASGEVLVDDADARAAPRA